jgi:hypothetical protein
MANFNPSEINLPSLFVPITSCLLGAVLQQLMNGTIVKNHRMISPEFESISSSYFVLRRLFRQLSA